MHQLLWTLLEERICKALEDDGHNISKRLFQREQMYRCLPSPVLTESENKQHGQSKFTTEEPVGLYCCFSGVCQNHCCCGSNKHVPFSGSYTHKCFKKCRVSLFNFTWSCKQGEDCDHEHQGLIAEDAYY